MNWEKYNTERKPEKPNPRKDRYQKDTKTRTVLAYGGAIFIALYIVAVCVFMYLYLFQKEVSQAVLITFLSTTTLNVLGLMYIILKGLFKNMGTSDKKKIK